jgi:hypothetical protein
MPGKRVDANHGEIRDNLRKIGYCVHDTSQYPGMLDLIVGAHGLLFWLEIKASEKDVLTDKEAAIFDQFRGYPVLRVHSVEDALGQIRDYVEYIG